MHHAWFWPACRVSASGWTIRHTLRHDPRLFSGSEKAYRERYRLASAAESSPKSSPILIVPFTPLIIQVYLVLVSDCCSRLFFRYLFPRTIRLLK